MRASTWIAGVILWPGVMASQAASSAPAQDGRPPKLHQIRFSPDGRYVLAQNDSDVTVLMARPLRVLFRIPAPAATPAEFSPDSKEVSFASPGPQADSKHIALAKGETTVERWNIENRTRDSASALRLPECETEGLSPDGGTLACVDVSGKLSIADVRSAAVILERPFSRQSVLFGPPGREFPVHTMGDPGLAIVRFSPDGRYLIASCLGGIGHPLAFEVAERRIVKLGGILSKLGGPDYGYFTFSTSDQVVTLSPFLREHRGFAIGRVVEFPSGKVIMKPRLPPDPLFPTMDPGFVLVRPFGKHGRIEDPDPRRSAAVELRTGQVIVSESPVLDVLGQFYVTQRPNGEVGLYERGKGLQAAVSLTGN